MKFGNLRLELRFRVLFVGKFDYGIRNWELMRKSGF